MAVRVGVAPDSWGVWFPTDPRQVPWTRFLDEVVEAGYDAIELGPFGYLPTDHRALSRELQARGLTLAGAFVFRDFADGAEWDIVRKEVEPVADLLLDLGAQHLVVINALYTDLFTGKLIGPAQLDLDSWRSMVSLVERVADYASARGISAVFHPHAETPIEYTAQVERLLVDTSSTDLSLCLDIGHIAYRRGDPIALIERFHERIAYLHLKTVSELHLREVEAQRLSFAQAVQKGTFCDLEDGSIDFKRLRDTLEAVGFDGWGIVEQDMYPVDFDKPLPSARRNREYLRQLGIG